LLKVLALAILGIALTSCIPQAYHIDERLPFTLFQSVKSRYVGKPAIIITVDDPSRTLQVIKAEHSPLRKLLGERTGYSFPIGPTFAAYLQQAQEAAGFYAAKEKAITVTATIENVDLYFSLRETHSSLSYIDWVSITLTIATAENGKVLQRTTLSRELSLKGAEIAYAFDRALRITLGQLVLDYLDEVVKHREEASR